MKISGGVAARAVVVRTDNARGPAVAPMVQHLYYIVPLQNLNGSLDYELRVARPEDGPSTLLARISGERVPLWQGLHPVISKDGKWLVMPLDDRHGNQHLGGVNHGWKAEADHGFWSEAHIHRAAISWSSDGKWVFAAVGEGDADIVQMDGLLSSQK